MSDTSNKKVKVYNLVILDKSGSMSSIRNAAISGLNETINGIRKAQLKYMGEQEHFFTLHTFCSCEQKNVYDNAPIAEVRDITEEDYVPCCCTPLYDAIGITLNDLKERTAKEENSIVVVTIITDGYENASKRFTGPQIAALISELREKGWAFAYMGADHDVEAVARKLNIVNTRTFSHDAEGTMRSMKYDSEQRMGFFASVHEFCCMAEPSLSVDKIKDLSDNLYDKEDQD